MTTRASVPLACAGMTALYLPGGIGVGLALSLPISAIPAPGVPHTMRNVVAGVAFLLIVFGASRVWGRRVASRIGYTPPGRLGKVASLSFAPSLIIVGTLLGVLEPVFVGFGAERGYAIHVVFALVFVPSAFVVAGVTALALGWATAGRPAGLRLAVVTGGAAAVAFLVVVSFMDIIGWRVGAPRAAERATMLVVTLLGALAAALAGGAALGGGLASAWHRPGERR